MIRLASFLLLLTFSTTALAAARKSEIVVVDLKADISGCERIGDVRAAMPWGGAQSDLAYGKVVGMLKKKTRLLGGNSLQVVDSSSTTAGTNVLGEALLCLPPSTAAAGR